MNYFHRKSAGNMLLSVLLGLIILLAMTPLMWNWIDMGLVAKQQRSAADHLQAVNSATGEYIKVHHVDLIKNTDKTTGITISIQDLIDEELLPEGFAHRNVWLHEYNIYLRQPQDNELQGIVLTHNSKSQNAKFNNVTIPSTAQLLGGAGGYIPTGDIPSQTDDMLIGSYQSWKMTLADYGITSPGAGHLGALATFGESELGLDFLYRIDVPGEPELNAMQTELDMTDHSIETVKDIQFVSHTIDEFICAETENQGRMFFDELEGLYMCRENEAVVVADTGNSLLFKEATIASNGDIIDKPVCPAGTDTSPFIFVTPSVVSAGEEATTLASFQTWATSLNDTQWQVHLRVLSKRDEWVYPEANYGKIMVFATCGATP